MFASWTIACEVFTYNAKRRALSFLPEYSRLVLLSGDELARNVFPATLLSCLPFLKRAHVALLIEIRRFDVAPSRTCYSGVAMKSVVTIGLLYRIGLQANTTPVHSNRPLLYCAVDFSLSEAYTHSERYGTVAVSLFLWLYITTTYSIAWRRGLASKPNTPFISLHLTPRVCVVVFLFFVSFSWCPAVCPGRHGRSSARSRARAGEAAGGSLVSDDLDDGR